LFAELKNQIGLRRLRLRRLRFVREQFFLAAAAQNIKRLVRFLSLPTPSPAFAVRKEAAKNSFTLPQFCTRSAQALSFSTATGDYTF
jgi:hypothetical protein